MIDVLAGALDGGSLVFRTGSAPANTTDSDSGTLLATCTFDATAFGAASNGVATAAAIGSDTNVDATGTPGHFRAKASGGAVVLQGTVGTSGAEANFNSTTWIAGGTVAISSMTLTQPAS